MLNGIPQASFYAAPMEEEIEHGLDALKHNKLAKLKSYNVKVFDMSKQDDIEEYEKLMPTLFEGVQTRTCVIWAKDRSLIDGVWKIYLEWSTYSIGQDKDTETE